MYRLFKHPAAAFVLAMTACTPAADPAIDGLFADYRGDGVPGAALRVIRDGEPVLTRTWGLADVGSGAPVTPATNFRLASLSKQFTAMSVLMLVADGRLTLDTRLTGVFPGFPAWGDDITIRYLLQHRSGLPDYEPLVPGDSGEQVHDDDVLRLMMAADGPDFEPGTRYRYSNSGYAVLAMVVEEISGMRFARFLEERIFEPVGMAGTVAYREGVSTVPNRAYGYTVDENGVQPSDQSVWSAVHGDGGVYSSLEDLTRWDRALYGDDLVPAELKAAMLTPALEGYGFGWWIDEYRGHRRYHHYGSTSGFRNFIQRFPELRLTVIVLTNRAAPPIRPLAEKVADRYLP